MHFSDSKPLRNKTQKSRNINCMLIRIKSEKNKTSSGFLKFGVKCIFETKRVISSRLARR